MKFLSENFSVSAWTGENVATLSPRYPGPTLFERIKEVSIDFPAKKPLRIVVKDCYNIDGKTVVLGNEFSLKFPVF